MSTVKYHLKSFLKETFKSFLKRPPLKETLRHKKFPKAAFHPKVSLSMKFKTLLNLVM